MIVCSMHGSVADGTDLPSVVLLPELLHRLEVGRPFLKPVSPGRWVRRGHAPVLPSPGLSWTGYMRWRQLEGRVDAFHPSPVRRRVGRARRALLGPPAPDRLRRDGGAGLRAELPGNPGRPAWSVEGMVPGWYRAQWPRMRAFALPTVYRGRIRLNVRGRERDGVVSPNDYGTLAAEIEREVRGCRDPRTGAPVVEDVHRTASDLWSAPPGEADLLVSWAGRPDAFEHPGLGIVGPFPYKRTGAHSDRGFAYLAGADASGELGEHPASDLPPTILLLLGRPIPPAIEGRPIPLGTPVR